MLPAFGGEVAGEGCYRGDACGWGSADNRGGDCWGRAPRAEGGEEFVLAAAAEEQEGERVVVEGVGDEVADRGGVFAGDGEVGAAAVGQDLACAWQQVQAGGVDVVDDLGWEFAVEERCHAADLG